MTTNTSNDWKLCGRDCRESPNCNFWHYSTEDNVCDWYFDCELNYASTYHQNIIGDQLCPKEKTGDGTLSIMKNFKFREIM